MLPSGKLIWLAGMTFPIFNRKYIDSIRVHVPLRRVSLPERTFGESVEFFLGLCPHHEANAKHTVETNDLGNPKQAACNWTLTVISNHGPK